jgi:azurin/lysophospholipase L1-like esterase
MKLNATALKLFALLSLSLAAAPLGAAPGTVVYEAKDGPGRGRHVVFLTGDEEYRSEEGLPMLARILSQRHGFKCTVLFPLGDDGTINPDNTKSLPGAAALDSADAVVMLTRFRAWPDEQMKHFADAYRRGVPIVALRTSTHAFKFDDGQYKSFNDFGKRVLGEEWVSHWGRHKVEATKGIIEPAAKDDPILRGVADVFGDSDVYEAAPPSDAKILLRGQVLKGMKPTDPPADYRKKPKGGAEQGVNDPMMPVAWTRIHKNEAGKENKVFCTTLGAATDLQSEGLRRIVVNAVYWGLGLDVPARADVQYVGEFKPTPYGFGGYRKGVKIEDHALQAGASSSAAPAATPSPRGSLQLNKGDHVALVGNTLPDRMQHSGHFETLIHAQYPEHDLVFRNLAVAGDEVVKRHRSENFGTPDEWLTKVKADVIFAFFGFNESFKGEEGLAQFKSDLDQFLKATLRKNYSGRGAPRVVLFSPIANERHQDPNFPDPGPNNARISLYTAAMSEVATSNGVQFIDLFKPSQDLYAAAANDGKSHTINGIHLSDEGDRLLAPLMFRSVFGADAPQGDHTKLRLAVNEKNWQWHQRYRTVDGYNVYGGRSKMEYEQGPGGPKLSNYKVMQEEMSQRDVLTANRDPVVWAAARGRDVKPDDSNLPPVTKVRSNKPGSNPDETFPFLTAEESMAKLKLHPGLKANIFASEADFPELVNPVQMAWDTKGRLWVAAWYTYPERTPTQEKGDSLLVFEDTNADGKADKCTHFLDDLNCPTGFQFYKDGVLLMQAPDLWFVRDTDGDGKADWKERVLMGLDSADSHHTTNSMVWDPGGAVYLSDGVFHRTQVETAWGPVRNDDAAIYRYEPRTGKFNTHIAYGFANPHGRVVDYWGNDFVTDATGNNTYFGPAFSGFLDYPQKHKTLRQFWERPSRPCPGTGILTSRHFPDDWQGNFLNLNVISFQGCYRVKVKQEGSGLWGESLPDLFYSDDPNFRPTFINTGPDGALYVADWHNPIIGHLQHHLRDPNRDHGHGRVFRITYEGRPLMKPAKIDGQPIPALLDLLKEPENQTRELAKVELGKHGSAAVAAAAKKWAAGLDPKDPAYWHHMAEALWVHQWHNVVDQDLLNAVLQSPEPNARAAATRVVCYWRDRLPQALGMLKSLAADQSPRVRLEAVRAASFFRTADAVGVVTAAKKLPTDYYLDYTIGETMRQLEPFWRKALAAGEAVATGDGAGTEYFLGALSAAELLDLPRKPAVLEAIVQRVDVPEAQRGIALHELSQHRKTSRAGVLVEMIEAIGRTEARAAEIGRLLPQQPAGDLEPLRNRLQSLASDVSTPGVRQSAWAAQAVADGAFEDVWKRATARSVVATRDLLAGIPLIYDPDVRAKAYDKVKPLLDSTAPDGDVADLRRASIGAAVSMNRGQQATFAALCAMIQKNQDVALAARGIRVLPRGAWTAQEGEAAARSIVEWAKKVPVGDRTTPEYVQAIQLAGDLAGLAPAESGSSLRNELKGLRVAVFVVNTVREQMRYDTPRLVVEAGKPFQIILENGDFMPHNLVVVAPGARKKVGEATMKMRPDQLDRQGRAFVPRGNEVLAATRLLEPGQREALKMDALNREGEYEYVCTYPGHWEMMWGTLVVTKDVDAYLRKNPEAKPVATGGSHEHGGHGK